MRPLGPVVSVSPEGLLRSVSLVRSLPNGAVLVHDLTGRQVVLLDSLLLLRRTVLDTSAASGAGYNSRIAGLIPYRGDSSLFIDPEALTMTVIDAAGETVRVMAIPRPRDADFMIGGPFGTPGVDPLGRIVYRGFAPADRRGASTGPPEPGKPFIMPQPPDSAPIVRVDLREKSIDTITWVKKPTERFEVRQTDKGFATTVRTNPMPVVDDWVLLADGRIAALRGRDYHVDWFAPDGARSSTPKVPFGWQRMSDDDKVRLIDSANVAWQAERERLNKQVNGGEGEGVPVGGAAMRAPPVRFQVPNYQPVDAKELADYRPAFRTGAMSVDTQGRLWIRTTALSDTGPVYDVVDASGTLVDRVRLPFGRVVSGFGPGVVYLGVLDDKGARLERARIR
ncbi:MAG TPA: hypothetical protein VGJ96_10380 [Gemmatimonadaceae bacterium]